MSDQITIGISACLLGQNVRFDGGHKRSNFCVNELGKHVNFKPFCPEVGVGLPSPRPTLRLVKQNDLIKICRPDGSGDVTDAMQGYSEKIAPQLNDISGYVFCSKSPSCGMERVKTYDEKGNSMISNGVGIFAQQVMQRFPLIPCEESGRLNDAQIKENFVLRIYVYNKWQTMVRNGVSKHRLIQFHSQHKYLLMSHDVQKYKSLGRLLATAHINVEELANQYITGLMQGLKRKATRKTHTNTLQHLQGYFKKQLNKAQKQELSQSIDNYRLGLLPLLAPLTLLKHYLREFPKAYLQTQSYFEPYPEDLKLRYGY